MVLVETDGKRPRGRPRHRWENNPKIILNKVIGGHGEDSSGLGQKEVNIVVKFGFHKTLMFLTS